MESRFEKPYNATEVEPEIYRKWEESGFFTPENLPLLRQGSGGQAGERTEPFTIIMPPPNVTGTLHVGHALMLVIQDALIRFERMRGKKALWLPGTDHAAIATQAKVEELLYKEEKKTRYDFAKLLIKMFGPMKEQKIVLIIWAVVIANGLIWLAVFGKI